MAEVIFYDIVVFAGGKYEYGRHMIEYAKYDMEDKRFHFLITIYQKVKNSRRTLNLESWHIVKVQKRTPALKL